MDTERQRYFLDKLVHQGRPLLFVGPTGTGKSAITNNYLLELPRDKFGINNINFSAQTSANQTQDIIFSKLDRYVDWRFHYIHNCNFDMIRSLND